MGGQRPHSRFRAKARMFTLPLLIVGIAAGIVCMASCGPRDVASHDPMGPNAACYVCHMTFVREELSRSHQAAKVGCIRCHGLSAPHANDEDVGATKPDVTYTRAQVNPACRKCHPTHNARPEAVVACWQQVVKTRFDSQPPPSPACTDCHGTHKIAKPR